MKSSYLLAALLLAPLSARAEDAAAKPQPAGAAFRQRVLEKFDNDKDGKLSDAERAAAKAAMREKSGESRAKALEHFDGDKDGKLSDSERATLKKTLKARRSGKGDQGQNGTKASAARKQLLEKFDEDQDGQLSEAERTKARAARKKRAGV